MNGSEIWQHNNYGLLLHPARWLLEGYNTVQEKLHYVVFKRHLSEATSCSLQQTSASSIYITQGKIAFNRHLGENSLQQTSWGENNLQQTCWGKNNLNRHVLGGKLHHVAFSQQTGIDYGQLVFSAYNYWLNSSHVIGWEKMTVVITWVVDKRFFHMQCYGNRMAVLLTLLGVCDGCWPLKVIGWSDFPPILCPVYSLRKIWNGTFGKP